MDQLRPLDVTAWPRGEHFRHYLDRVPCSHAVTVPLDVTATVAALRDTGRKTYPAHVWAITRAVNDLEPFRMSITEAGEPAVWDAVHPAFTVLNPERETFSCVWTAFDPDFAAFHDRASSLLAEHRTATAMFPQGDRPPNTFDVSSMPWTGFSSFSLQVDGPSRHLLPIVTVGRQDELDGRARLPVAVQVHHAAADGLHVARLLDR